MDYDHAPWRGENEAQYRRSGWSESAYFLYRHGFVADTHVQDPEELKRIITHAKLSDRLGHYMIQRIVEQLRYNLLPLLMLLSVLLLCLPLFSLDQKRYMALLCLGTMGTGVILWLLAFRWLQPRLVYVILGTVLWAMMIRCMSKSGRGFCIKKLNLRVENRHHWLVFLVICIAVFAIAGHSYRNLRDHHRHIALEANMRQLDPQADQLYVVWGRCLFL